MVYVTQGTEGPLPEKEKTGHEKVSGVGGVRKRDLGFVSLSGDY